MLRQRFLHPVLRPPGKLQVFFHQSAAADDGNGKLQGLCFFSCIFHGQWLVFCIEQCADLPVGFQYGKFHGGQIHNALFPKMLRQLIRGQACFLKVFQEDLSVFHQNDRFAAQQLPDRNKMIGQGRKQNLYGQDGQDWNHTGEQRNPQILHGNRRQIRNQHCNDEFRRLHFPDLALAHQTNHQDQQQVQNDGSQQTYQHFRTSRTGCSQYTRFFHGISRKIKLFNR